MEEILFRGRSSQYGFWEEGYVHETYDPETQAPCFVINRVGSSPVKVDPETIGQYIGVKDAVRRKIFDGDILSDGKCEAVVGARDAGWVMKYEDSLLDARIYSDFVYYKVVDNIHDRKARKTSPPRLVYVPQFSKRAYVSVELVEEWIRTHNFVDFVGARQLRVVSSDLLLEYIKKGDQ